ncbi:MAG: FliM/FliN family flagellar motor switch protein [Clostridia bacterium]
MKKNISFERNTNAKELSSDKKIEVNKVEFEEFSPTKVTDNSLGIEFIPKLELNVKVELSKTKIKARDILDLKKGDVVKLDSIAGDHVDVLLNEKEIAKGEVIVLDGSYGIRISKMKRSKEEKSGD